MKLSKKNITYVMPTHRQQSLVPLIPGNCQRRLLPNTLSSYFSHTLKSYTTIISLDFHNSHIQHENLIITQRNIIIFQILHRWKAVAEIPYFFLERQQKNQNTKKKRNRVQKPRSKSRKTISYLLKTIFLLSFLKSLKDNTLKKAY